MGAVAGFLSSADATTNDLAGEWMDEILVRQGKSANMKATLFALMSHLTIEETDNLTFNWWERDPVRRTFYSAGAENSSDTTFVFTDVAAAAHDGSTTGIVWQLLKAGMILLNDTTGEYVRVTATPTTANVTVSRAFGYDATTGAGGVGASVTTSHIWTLVSLGKAEGANPVEARYEQPSSYLNYIQTFNSYVSLTNAYKAGVLRTDQEGPKAQLISQALEQICNDIEFAFFLNPKATTGTTYYTGGLKEALDVAATADTRLTDNILNGNGSSGVTLDALLLWIESFMTSGSDTKIAFGGAKAFGALSRYANSAAGGFRIMQPTNSESEVSKKFGLNLTVINTPNGELSLCQHPLFKNTAAYNDWMFVVDLQLLKMKSMEPLFYEDNIQLPGQDSYAGQFRSKLGLKQQFPGAFGYAYDLQSINP